MDRREFIASSVAVVAATAIPAHAEVAKDQRPLPPSIAALPSMRDQAKPITNDERRTRIEHARELLQREKIAALVLTPGTSLVYFTNMRWSGGERLFAAVIPAKGE